MRARTLAWLLFGCLAVTPISPLHAAESADMHPVDLSSYEGHWERIDDRESEAARLLAIDGAINGLSWIMRKMASGVLRNTTTPPPEMEFVWDGEKLHQGLQGEDRSSARPVVLDGELRRGEDTRGVPFTWAWIWTETGLRVNWEQHQAHGNNVYRIDTEDDQTLLVQHTINVTAISDIEPIVYLSRFSRTDTPERTRALVDHAANDANN